jgi:hypothetical protein
VEPLEAVRPANCYHHSESSGSSRPAVSTRQTSLLRNSPFPSWWGATAVASWAYRAAAGAQLREHFFLTTNECEARVDSSKVCKVPRKAEPRVFPPKFPSARKPVGPHSLLPVALLEQLLTAMSPRSRGRATAGIRQACRDAPEELLRLDPNEDVPRSVQITRGKHD